MGRALLVVVAAAAGVVISSIGIDAQVGVPGQVTPARPAPAGTSAPTGTAVIRGTVVAMDTGTPLRRVQVRAMGNTPDARGSRVTTTDDDGRFELRELPAGRYNVHATKAGFVSLQYGQRRPNERGTPVEVADGQIVDKVTIGLPRGGVITGRISDDIGEPIAAVRVQAMRFGFVPGGRRLQPVAAGGLTDDTGAFRIYGLPPGDYYVTARPDGMAPMMWRDDRLATGDSDPGFAPTYYPGTPSASGAQRVTVGVGQEVAGITFGLAPTRLSRVSGRVIGWPSTMSMGFIMAEPVEDTTMDPMLPPGQIQPEGDFEIRGMAPGRYTLRVQPRSPRGGDELVGIAEVTVAGIDLANVTIALQPPGTMTGRIEFEGGVPSALRASQVRMMFMPASQRMVQMTSGPPEVADDFTFRLRGVLGSIFLRPNGPPGWSLKAVILDGEDVTDTPMSVLPGRDIDGVRVLLSQTRTTVSGAVKDDRGNAVVDATVLVFPDDEARWRYGSRHIRSTRPDTEGRFELTGLAPSDGYRILALPSLEDGQAFDPEFLSSLRDRADRLSLNEGESKAVELRLRP